MLSLWDRPAGLLRLTLNVAVVTLQSICAQGLLSVVTSVIIKSSRENYFSICPARQVKYVFYVHIMEPMYFKKYFMALTDRYPVLKTFKIDTHCIGVHCYTIEQ